MLLKRSEGYPSFTMVDTDAEHRVIGFVQLSAYNPMPTFKKAAAFTCFVDPEYTGKGLGALALEKVETDARAQGITTLISDISTENEGCIRFHLKHGFREAGRLENVGEKLGRSFGLVYMQKTL